MFILHLKKHKDYVKFPQCNYFSNSLKFGLCFNLLANLASRISMQFDITFHETYENIQPRNLVSWRRGYMEISISKKRWDED